MRRALVLLGVALLTTACGDEDRRANSVREHALERLTAACEEHPPPSVRKEHLLFATGQTAGEITQIAKMDLGRTLPPWDSLPSDHPVAVCSYSQYPLNPGTPPPDFTGPVYPPESTPSQYLVDESGRWSEYPFVDLAPTQPAAPPPPPGY
jgi:hypothetical protein